MGRSPVAWLLPLTALTLSTCTTDVCGCPPTPATALVYGRVISATGEAVSEAGVRAYSTPAPGCQADEGVELDFGGIASVNDGTFALGLPGPIARDSACVFVFALPPAGVATLAASDTTLISLDFRYDAPQDSARVDLVLKAR